MTGKGSVKGHAGYRLHAVGQKMLFRVVNTLTDEVIAELGNEDLAVSIAEGCARDCGNTEQFAVYELVLRYETAPVKSDK